MTQAPVKTPAEVARAAFDAVIARDPDAVVANSAEDVVDNFVAIGVFTGREAVKALFVELFAAAPDFTMVVDRIVSDDSSAVVQWHAAGTFTGTPFQGIHATGRRVEVLGADVMEISDGLIQRNTIYYDGAGFARQIGLLPPQNSRADRAMLAAFNAKTEVRRRLRG